MRDYIDIGPSPADEPCAQLGSEGYEEKAHAECKRFIALIRKKFGPAPPGASLKIKSNAHDFGIYYEVVCYYDTEDKEAIDYAFKCESDTPLNWED
jgi:hypothetical protein